MAMYYCDKCGMNVDEKGRPDSRGCSCAPSHVWYSVKTNKRWYCTKCHKSVYSDNRPDGRVGGGCSIGNSHSWTQA